jgi:alcohol dehydrogenase class IV
MVSSSFTFANERNYTVISGRGCLDQLATVLDRLGITRPLLVVPRSLADSELTGSVVGHAGNRTVVVFAGARAHAPISCVRKGLDLLTSSDCDGIISLGGSSAVDVAKGIAMLAAYGSLDALRGSAVRSGDRLQISHADLGGALMPIVAIPTTLSGAEFTYQSGITDEDEARKYQYYDRGALPRYIFLDAQATEATPDRLWLTTGIKALDHDVERLYSRDHQPLADALELESLQRIVHDLPASTSDRNDRQDSRQRLLEAAWLAQFATKNVNVGVGHALGHQIAGLLDVPHGEIACVLLPYSIQFNAVAGEAQLLRVCSALGLEPSVSALCESIRILVQSLGMPSRLRDIGVPLNSLNGIAERTLSDTAMTGNPRLVERAGEIMDEILSPAW